MGMITGTNSRDSSRSISVGVDALDVADEAEVRRVAPIVGRRAPSAGVDEAAVLAVEPDRAAAVPVDEPDELLVELVERHFDHRAACARR